ncbi:MAG: hybrid-cluster NAD(P)-dependent oxidoreductase [Pseudomonadota bacterium]
MNPFARPPARPDWRPDRWGTMRCLAVRAETPDIKTFVLTPDDGGRITFEAGQFMTFRMDVADAAVERCYTLSSSAAGGRTVEITVKRKPDGAFSGTLHDSLHPGATIECFGPAGRFGPSSLPAHKYLFLGAGSGATPMLSILRTAADLAVDIDAVAIQIARHPRDLIAADEMAPLARRLPRLRTVSVVSGAPKRWRGTVGRLDAAMLTSLVPDLAARSVLCCGPESFMAAMRDACLSADVPDERYMEESFDFGAMEEAAATGPGPTRRITFAKSGRSFDCPDGLTILQAAKAAGVPVASSCTRGICGTCKALKLSGEVAMSHNGGIRDREIARGFILPCSSRPQSDIVLDR